MRLKSELMMFKIVLPLQNRDIFYDLIQLPNNFMDPSQLNININ